jgi:hypothetical protein
VRAVARGELEGGGACCGHVCSCRQHQRRPQLPTAPHRLRRSFNANTREQRADTGL